MPARVVPPGPPDLDAVTHWTSPTGYRFDKPPDELAFDITVTDRNEAAPY